MTGIDLFERMDIIEDKYIAEAMEEVTAVSKKKYWWQWMAAAFVLAFIGVVNLCPGVAVAMNNVVGLKELVQVVTFDKSMKACLENEYAQYIGEEQITKDGHYSKVYYVVADASHISVFYKTDVPYTGEGIHHFPTITNTEGNFFYSSMVAKETDIKDSYEFRMDFLDDIDQEGLPKTLHFDISYGTAWENGKPSTENGWIQYPDAVSSYEIQLDDKFFVEAQQYTIDKKIELDGQSIWLDELKVYPTKTKLIIHEDTANDKRLCEMDAELLDKNGEECTRTNECIQAICGENGELTGYYLCYESNFFADTQGLQIVLKGAEWESVDVASAAVSYENKSVGVLPEKCELLEMQMDSDNTLLLRLKMQSTEDLTYSDEVWNEETGDFCEDTNWDDYEEEGYYIREYRIANYQEGMYKMNITKYEWVRPENPILIDVK